MGIDPLSKPKRESGVSMKTEIGKFKFAVPEGHPQAGEKVEKPFEYQVCENLDEAQAALTERKLDVVELVNDKLKSNARSNAYQAALLPYRPSEVPAEDIVERMVRDYIRLGVSEDVARKQVEGMRALAAAAESQAAPVTE
jgi:hypothetical protein